MVSKGTRRLAVACTHTEWVCRALLIILSILQSILITSPKGDYCIHKSEALTVEVYWMVSLVSVQISKVVLYTMWQLWQIRLINKGQDASLMSFSSQDNTL